MEQTKKMQKIILELAKTLGILGGLGLLYLLIFRKFHLGIPCVFHLVTGLDCPGCGMTRAMSQLAQGHVVEAFQYNALSITLLPVLCLYLLFRFIRNGLQEREGFAPWETVFLTVMLIITVAYGILRNLN